MRLLRFVERLFGLPARSLRAQQPIAHAVAFAHVVFAAQAGVLERPFQFHRARRMVGLRAQRAHKLAQRPDLLVELLAPKRDLLLQFLARVTS